MNDIIEQAYWKFDAMRNGYAEWRNLPKSERDAFKLACVSVVEAENAQLKAELEQARADYEAASHLAAITSQSWKACEAELAQARYLRENAESALNTHMEIHARVVNELRAALEGEGT